MDHSRMCWMLALVLAGASARAPAQEAPTPAPGSARLIELIAGSSFEFVAEGSSQAVLIPVAPAKDLEAGDSLSSLLVRDVALGSRHLGGLRQKLAPSLVLDSKNQPTDLKLVVDLDAFVEPGTYDVTLEVARDDSAARQRPPLLQRLKVQLVHPTATLATVSPLTIEHVVPYAIPLLDNPRSPKLELQETSRHSHVTGLRVQDDPKDHESWLRLTPPTSVGWKAPAVVEYALTGSPPVGSTSTGSITVVAPQLAAAFQVPYSLHTRLSRFFLLFTLVLGLGAGFTLRICLGTRIEQSRKKLESQQFRARLQSESSQHADATFRSKVAELEQALETAEAGQNVTTLDQALAAAAAGLKEALDALATRRQQTRAKVEALITLLDRPWQFPSSVDAILQDLRRQAAEMTQLFETDDVGGAAQREAALSKAAAQQLREAIGAWRRAASEKLTQLLAGPSSLPCTVEAGVTEAAGPVQQRLRDEPERQVSSSLDGTLESVNTTWSLFRNFLTTLRWRLYEVAVSVQKTLREQDPPDPTSLDALGGKVRELDARWSDQTLGNPDKLPALDADVAGVLATFKSVIEANALDSNKDKVKAALDDRQFEEAAALARKRQQKVLSGNAPSAAPLAAPVPAPWNILAWLVPPPPTLPVHLRAAIGGAQISIQQQMTRTWDELARAKAWEFLISGLLILMGGYIVFADSFSGTATNLAAVFFWAFGLDIGAGSLTSLGSRFPGPGRS